MFHRTPEKYKEYEGKYDINVGKATIKYNEFKQAWIGLDGKPIKDKNKAIELAKYIDYLYQGNMKRLQKKSPYITQQIKRFKR